VCGRDPFEHAGQLDVAVDGWEVSVGFRPLESPSAVTVTNPPAGANTGPSDVTSPQPGILSVRQRTTNFAIANAVSTTVPLNTVVVENGITWDTPNSRWVIPRDGRYQVSAQVHFNTSATGYRRCEIRQNGAYRAFGQPSSQGPTSYGVGVSASIALKCAAGDVVSITALQGSGGNLDVYGDASQGPTVASITFLGA
jgi:hypothetical protein